MKTSIHLAPPPTAQPLPAFYPSNPSCALDSLSVSTPRLVGQFSSRLCPGARVLLAWIKVVPVAVRPHNLLGSPPSVNQSGWLDETSAWIEIYTSIANRVSLCNRSIRGITPCPVARNSQSFCIAVKPLCLCHCFQNTVHLVIPTTPDSNLSPLCGTIGEVSGDWPRHSPLSIDEGTRRFSCRILSDGH